MQCPTDGATLVMSERSGIEIDYCPDCRGIWLDRGELDKLIERSYAEPMPTQPGHGQPGYGQRGHQGYGQQDYGQPGQGQQSGTAAMVGKVADQVMRQVQQRSGGQPQGYGQRQGRRSWLGDILR